MSDTPDQHDKIIKKEEPPTGLVAWFVNNHVAANILMMVFIVGGLFSLQSMRTETFPSIDPRLVTVTTVYPGATPYEIEESITSRVEESLVGIEGVKRITATASENIGIVSIELKDFADEDEVYNDVETAVNSLSDFPPEDAERPMVQKAKVTPNVMTLAIHGNVSERAIKYWAETIEDDLQDLDGVANTSITGVRDYEISIEISEDKLRQYGLSLREVNQIVQQFSVDIPAGTIESQRGDILLRVQEKKYTRSEFEEIVLRANSDGSKLYLRDVATIIDGFADSNLESRFNGARSVLINVSRSETGDTLTIADTLKNYLSETSLPKGLTLSIQNDETVILEDRINLMVRNAIIGFMLVFVVLLFFLDLKLAFWTSVAIPVSFLGGIMIMNAFGLSINMISVFALIVVLGVVVDDAIIVGESIFEEQRRSDEHDKGAVLRAVYSVMGPVTIGVLTTIAAFAPLLFSTGTLGQIIGVIPAVVIPILVISLLEAYFILPSHLSKPNQWSAGIVGKGRNKFAGYLRHFTDNHLAPFVGMLLRFRYAVLASFIVIAVITAVMFSTGIIRFLFFPDIESDRVEIALEMNVGTPYDTTVSTIDIIENHVSDLRDELEDGDKGSIFKFITTNIGQTITQGGGPDGGGTSRQSNSKGQIQIDLVPSNLRDVTAVEIEDMLRNRIGNLPNVDSLEFQSSLIAGGADIEVELKHEDDALLSQIADDLKDRLSRIEGTVDIKDSFQDGKVEYVFDITDEGHAVGVTPAQLGQALRGAFFGYEVQRLQRGQSEVIVYVRYPKEERENLEALRNMRITLENGNIVPLSSIAIIRQQTGFSTINSVNGQRIVSVTADADTAIATPNEIMAQMRETILPDLQNRYQGLDYSFEGESRDQAEDLASLGRNMLIALLIIYVLLGSQLRSYVQPLIIMSAIPFGIIGAIWGHFLLGQAVTFISLFGMVALSGVVVNDSVVLIDYLNKQRLAGKNAYDAALMAIKRRFRPILLTTLTTSIGLLPILLEPSTQAQFLVPMVISLATGIIFATVIILILIPALILVSEDVKNLKDRTFKKQMAKDKMA